MMLLEDPKVAFANPTPVALRLTRALAPAVAFPAILMLSLVFCAAAQERAPRPNEPAEILLTLADLGKGVPDWAKEKLPEWVEPYVGRKGLPSPWCDNPAMLANSVGSFDHWQANRFVVY